MKKALIRIVALTAATVVSGQAWAAVNVTISQVGADVVARATGTLDLTGLSPFGAAFPDGDKGVGPSAGLLLLGATGDSVNYYTGLIGPGGFGSGTGQAASASSGTAFSLYGTVLDGIYLSSSYVSNSQFTSSATFAGTTLAGLGATSGAYNYKLGSNDITLNIGGGAGPVPEPATWAMMLLGFGMLGGAIRYGRRKATVAIA